jgi:hypothetical protein
LQGILSSVAAPNSAQTAAAPDELLQQCCTFEQLEIGQVPVFGTAPRLIYPAVITFETADAGEDAAGTTQHALTEMLHQAFRHVLQTADPEMKQINKPLTVTTITELREQYPEYNAVLVPAPFQRDILGDPTTELYSVYCPAAKHAAFTQGCLGKLVHPRHTDDSGIDMFSDVFCHETLRFMSSAYVAYLYRHSAAHYFSVGGLRAKNYNSVIKTSLDAALAIETDGFIRWNWK